MELREQRLTDVVVGYTCDICGGSCGKGMKSVDASEYATLRANWGYWSDKDLTWHECHMCERCFDKVKQFIEQELKGTVRTGTK
jgi:hypothetical protein